MKFLADMGISLRTVAWLRDLNHDVFHLRDRGLQTLPNNEILDLASAEQRIILTIDQRSPVHLRKTKVPAGDLEFAQLLAIGRRTLPSVILFRLGNENYNEINLRLREILGGCQNELDSGAIISVNNETFRVKKLSI